MSDQIRWDLTSDQVRSDQMGADLRLGQIRSDQMKKDPLRSEPDPFKVQISEIITAPHLQRRRAVCDDLRGVS